MSMGGTKNGTKIVSCNVPGDGSCFFHSIAFLINYGDIRNCHDARKRQQLGIHMRKSIVDPKQWKRYKQLSGYGDLAPPLSSVRKVSYAAGDFLINFVCRRLGLNVLVLDTSSAKREVYLFPCGQPDQPYVCLRWLSKVHFEPMAEVSSTNMFVPSRFPAANDRSLKGVLDMSSTLVQQMMSHCVQATASASPT